MGTGDHIVEAIAIRVHTVDRVADAIICIIAECIWPAILPMASVMPCIC